MKVFQVKVTGCAGVWPGSILEVPARKLAEFPKASLSVKSFRISAPAALNVLCPELHSGNGGVGKAIVISW